MTRPDPLKEMAEKVLVIADCARGESVDRSSLILNILRTAHRQGQESMRERAAKLIEENSHRSCGRGMADSIRSLPTEPEGKDANVDSNVVYTGQCRHNIPYGQPCIGCQRS